MNVTTAIQSRSSILIDLIGKSIRHRFNTISFLVSKGVIENACRWCMSNNDIDISPKIDISDHLIDLMNHLERISFISIIPVNSINVRKPIEIDAFMIDYLVVKTISLNAVRIEQAFHFPTICVIMITLRK